MFHHHFYKYRLINTFDNCPLQPQELPRKLGLELPRQVRLGCVVPAGQNPAFHRFLASLARPGRVEPRVCSFGDAERGRDDLLRMDRAAQVDGRMDKHKVAHVFSPRHQRV